MSDACTGYVFVVCCLIPPHPKPTSQATPQMILKTGKSDVLTQVMRIHGDLDLSECDLPTTQARPWPFKLPLLGCFHWYPCSLRSASEYLSKERSASGIAVTKIIGVLTDCSYFYLPLSPIVSTKFEGSHIDCHYVCRQVSFIAVYLITRWHIFVECSSQWNDGQKFNLCTAGLKGDSSKAER